MKKTACFVIALLSSLLTVYGDLGDSPAQFDKLYGKSVASYTKEQLEAPGWVPPRKIEWDATLAYVYSVTPTCTLVAWFKQVGDKTVCNALYFSSYNKTDDLLEQNLPTAKPKISWQENRGQRNKYAGLLIKGYIRSDGKAVASYIERDVDGKTLYELIIFSPLH